MNTENINGMIEKSSKIKEFIFIKDTINYIDIENNDKVIKIFNVLNK